MIKKKILTLSFIVILISLNCFAEEPQLPPPLPTLEVSETDNSNKDSKSFWDKILDFFGFGSKKQSEPSPQPKEQDIEIESNLPGQEQNLKAPQSGQPELPKPQQAESSNVELPKSMDNNAELQIPSGFTPEEEQAEAKNSASGQQIPVETKPNSDIASANPEDNKSVNIPKNAPEQQQKEAESELKIPNLDEKSEIKPQEMNPVEVNHTETKSPDAAKTTSEVVPTEIKPSEADKNDDKTISEGTSNSSSDTQNVISQDIATQLPSANVSSNKSNDATENKKLASDQQAPELEQKSEIVEQNPEEEESKTITPKVNKKNDKDVKEIKKQVEQNVVDNDVANYRKHLRERLNKDKVLPTVSEQDRRTILPVETSEELEPKQLKFVNDEAQVLVLPNDEVVLGMLTYDAQIELMDFSSYVKLFWDNYNLIKNEPARKAIEHFIDVYDNKPHSYSKKEINDAFIDASSAIEKDRIYDLIALLDNYPILQLTDQNGDTLLHKAAYSSNYPAVKLLLMKGIRASKINYKNLTALDIATIRNKVSVIVLLESAGAF